MVKQINGLEIERKQDTENIYILKVLLVLALILRLDVQGSLTKEKGEVLVVLQRLLQKQDAKLAARIQSDLVSAQITLENKILSVLGR